MRTETRFVHPWFGPLDAAGWHALAGVHLKIHHEQIRRIIAGQTSDREATDARKITARPFR